jgi:hypothetical protein
MLSSIPKLVDKNFVVGFIIPVLLAAIGLLALLRDHEPVRSIYAAAVDADSFEKLTVIVLLLWAVAILLSLMNHTLYRLLEGYTGPLRCTAWKEARQEEYRTERQRLKATYAIVSNPKVFVSEELKRDYYAEVRRFAERWPTRRTLVLPTRFGNVVLAFETYPDQVYGADAIPAWLRLQGVMSKDALAQVEDARTQVNCCVNIVFLALLFAIVAAGHLALNAYGLRVQPERLVAGCWGYAAAAAGGALVSRLAYLGAVERAVAWGGLVKSAFDLYLPALARQLGYGLPPAEAKRRLFWRTATSSFLYQVPIKSEDWPAAKPAGGAAGGAAAEDADEDADETG